MTVSVKTYRLDGTAISLVFVRTAATIDLIYLGPLLPGQEDLAGLAESGRFGRHENQPDVPPIGGLLPEAKNGFADRPALGLRVAGVPVETDFVLHKVTGGAGELTAVWLDSASHLEVSAVWDLGADDVIRCHYCYANRGDGKIVLEQAPALVLPMPMLFRCMTSFPGRWAAEMQECRHELGPCAIEMNSSGGKPGFDPGNWLLFHGDDGSLIGCHLAWNGDHRSSVTQNRDGRATLITQAVLDREQAVLQPGQELSSATAILTYAPDQDRLAQKFHHHVRTAVLPRRAEWGPRKVHLNTWESLGYDLSEPALIALAVQAAALGVERFVLDDGWFKGRRSDRAGLGDWTVDPDIFPNSLGPLIAHVKGLGMDFGLWIEPEMVSPDSDLYRRHPDWCIHNSGAERPTQRHQLVLDLSRVGVMDYLVEAIGKLLSKYDIAYLKWDHNRSVFPAGTAQTKSYTQLLTAISEAHPHVDIENCASGGGRIDLKSLALAHRVWPSDNNDPIERLRINRGWARFLPLEVLGNHVGPCPNPITGRRTDIDFRAKVAMFGHMGVEANPAEMTPDERAVLAAHIALYKQWRDVLHQGLLWRLAHPHQGVYGQIAVCGDKAIAFAAQTAFAETFNVAPVRLKGLEADAHYRVTLPKPWATKASRYLADAALWDGKLVLSGTALMERGLALPLAHPETAWLITLEKVTGR